MGLGQLCSCRCYLEPSIIFMPLDIFCLGTPWLPCRFGSLLLLCPISICQLFLVKLLTHTIEHIIASRKLQDGILQLLVSLEGCIILWKYLVTFCLWSAGQNFFLKEPKTVIFVWQTKFSLLQIYILHCFPPFSTIFATAQLVHLHFIMYAYKLSTCSELYQFPKQCFFSLLKIETKEKSLTPFAQNQSLFSSVDLNLFHSMPHFLFRFLLSRTCSFLYHLLIFVLNISQYKSMSI